MRVGGILRLARAGVLQRRAQKGGSSALVAVVPMARGARGWQRAVDTQGNQYRIAPGGGLVPGGEPRPEREPASVANVAYYYAQALALMAARYRRQGLLMAAEVLDLPAADPSVRRAQRAFCHLFSRLGIVGAVRQKLYRNLVGVAHRVPAGVRVENHVHRFGVTVPVGWRLLAGSLPKLGPEATVLVLAVPSSSAGGARANVLWTTTRAPKTGTLAKWATKAWLRTPGAAITPADPLRPPGVTAVLTRSIGPVTYRGRALQSEQTIFLERGRLHRVTLLYPHRADRSALRQALAQVLATFGVSVKKHPCGS